MPITIDAIPTLPIIGDMAEQQRINDTSLRRRMLENNWSSDLEKRIRAHVGQTRAAGWGMMDLAANPLLTISRELASLYTTGEPSITHPTANLDDLTKALRKSGLWSIMPRMQANVIGCREYALRIGASTDRLTFRPVCPDMLIAEADESEPNVPVSIRELRLRNLDGRLVWTWDIWDVRDPSYTIELADPPYTDVTRKVLEDKAGIYPYVWEGEPFLPWVIYHAERAGDRIWNWTDNAHLVEGTLNLATLRTFGFHIAKDDSWPQRWAYNARPQAIETVDSDGYTVRQEVLTDPSILLIFEAIDRDVTPQIGQFQAGGNIKEFWEGIQAYAAWVASDAGISDSDLIRTSGDPRSGYALSLSSEGKRSASRRFAPHFRIADLEMLSISCKLLNLAHGKSLPTDELEIVYPTIPLSPEELAARRQHVLELVDAGLMRRVDAYMELHPGMSEEQARKELAEIDEERQQAQESQQVTEGNPYKIVEADGKFQVVKIDDGKVMGTHDTRGEAMAQLEALEASYHQEYTRGRR